MHRLAKFSVGIDLSDKGVRDGVDEDQLVIDIEALALKTRITAVVEEALNELKPNERKYIHLTVSAA